MPEALPDKVRSVEYLNYLAESHPGRYDQDIAACCAWAARKITHSEGIIQDILNAIKGSGHDLMPCRLCGSVMLTVPKESCVCKICAKKEKEQS